VLAAAFPGIGRTHRQLVKQMPHLAFFGGMVHDDGGGQVRRWLSREPLVTYRMAARDRERLFKAIHILALPHYTNHLNYKIVVAYCSEMCALDCLNMKDMQATMCCFNKVEIQY
jgi:hypothetical protein